MLCAIKQRWWCDGLASYPENRRELIPVLPDARLLMESIVASRLLLVRFSVGHV